MPDFPIERERVLLDVVARSRGDWSTRDIDFEVNRRLAPGELTVLDELKILQRRGLVERTGRSDDSSFTGWRITPDGDTRLSGLG